MRKKLLALLLASALALGLLAGCGGGESVASALLKLLDGRYPNISIEIDPDLEADLRQAIRKAEAENAGDDAAVIRAALETALGSTITFRNLRNGQKGETAFDLVFYAGSDPDKAAQAAYSQWNPILSNVPDDGKYDTSLAMVETNSGVWMLVKATVEKAGTVDKPDTDDDEPEPEKPKDPYTKNADGNYTVNTSNGLQQLFTDKKDIGDFTGTITLTCDQTVKDRLADTFKGTLEGKEGSKPTITLTGSKGLFGTIRDGTVQNLAVDVTGTITADGNRAGAIADENYGSITGCTVTVNDSIQATRTVTGDEDNFAYAGGIVGTNGGTIEHCDVTISGSITADASSTSTDLSMITEANAGGIAGLNGGTIESSCSVELNGGSIQATATGGGYALAYAGGIVGTKNGGTVSCGPAKNAYAACSGDNGTYTATVSAGNGDSTDTAGTIDELGLFPAQAGTQCGWDGNIDGLPTPQPSTSG